MHPLAALLGLRVEENWSDEDPVEQIAESLRHLEDPVLVCWRHQTLPALARAILAGDGIPAHWPEDRFDLTWSIRCENDAWVFIQVPQLLFATDRVDIL